MQTVVKKRMYFFIMVIVSIEFNSVKLTKEYFKTIKIGWGFDK